MPGHDKRDYCWDCYGNLHTAEEAARSQQEFMEIANRTNSTVAAIIGAALYGPRSDLERYERERHSG